MVEVGVPKVHLRGLLKVPLFDVQRAIASQIEVFTVLEQDRSGSEVFLHCLKSDDDASSSLFFLGSSSTATQMRALRVVNKLPIFVSECTKIKATLYVPTLRGGVILYLDFRVCDRLERNFDDGNINT